MSNTDKDVDTTRMSGGIPERCFYKPDPSQRGYSINVLVSENLRNPVPKEFQSHILNLKETNSVSTLGSKRVEDYTTTDATELKETIAHLLNLQYKVRKQLVLQTLAKLRRMGKPNSQIRIYEKRFEEAHAEGDRDTANLMLDHLERLLDLDF